MNDFKFRLRAGYTGTIPLGGRIPYFMHKAVKATTKFPPAESPTNTILSGFMSGLKRIKKELDSAFYFAFALFFRYFSLTKNIVDMLEYPLVNLKTVIKTFRVGVLWSLVK